MPDLSSNPRIRRVCNFSELIGTPFSEGVNALCWERTLAGDYGEVVGLLGADEGIVTLDEERLRALPVSAAGKIAVEQMLADLKLLQDHALAPLLNCIYDCVWSADVDTVPTDVLSFHVDSAPVEVDTWLCTYHGDVSEGLRNEDATRKVDIPETRATLLKELGGVDDTAFAEWLHENCFDRHYAPKPGAQPYAFGRGNLWRIATQWPGCPVPPCIHRAPLTHPGDTRRLLLIS